MRFTILAIVVSTVSLVTSAPAPVHRGLVSTTTSIDDLQAEANANILATLDRRHDDLVRRGLPSTCNNKTVVKRKEYGSLTSAEKKDYINAVLCLQQKPALTPLSAAPGVRSRYDDFVATHINQTLSIHYTGNFLSWHRNYVWLYEQALRNECGYKGYQPYWEWSKYVSAPQDAPQFDGSATSLSGNGEYISGRNETVLASTGVATLYLEPGLGGGCIYQGPFVNYTVNMGPSNSLAYNPRCLSRDINPSTAGRFLTTDDITFILQKPDIYDFQMNLQGIPGIGIGAHGGGHYTVGLEMSDLFSSPSDPAFFLHHGQVDRMWAIWQGIDPANRTLALSQTLTYLNSPASRNTTLTDTVDAGYAGGTPKEIRDVMSTVQGDFCYIYV